MAAVPAPAPAVRKFIPPPLNAPVLQREAIAHEQGAFKTIGWKSHQPVDDDDDGNSFQFSCLHERGRPASIVVALRRKRRRHPPTWLSVTLSWPRRERLSRCGSNRRRQV